MGRTPKNERYFDLIETLASLACESANTFAAFDTEYSPREKLAKLSSLESQADAIVGEVRDMLDSHQDPPLEDHESIARLVDNIDNIPDGLKKAANFIVLADLEFRPEFLAMGRLVKKAAQEIEKTLPLLRELRSKLKIKKSAIEKLRQGCVTVSQIEAEGDAQEFKAKRTIMEHYPTVTWQAKCAFETVSLLEHVLNQCEDVAKFVDAIKKKNA